MYTIIPHEKGYTLNNKQGPINGIVFEDGKYKTAKQKAQEYKEMLERIFNAED